MPLWAGTILHCSIPLLVTNEVICTFTPILYKAAGAVLQKASAQAV